MKLTGLAALILVASPLLTACASGVSCDDRQSLAERLADTEPDDPGYNGLVEDLNRAEADCNAR
jgi:hypothetical protein